MASGEESRAGSGGGKSARFGDAAGMAGTDARARLRRRLYPADHVGSYGDQWEVQQFRQTFDQNRLIVRGGEQRDLWLAVLRAGKRLLQGGQRCRRAEPEAGDDHSVTLHWTTG
ncbi:hypothetical protein HMP09_0728 [Sphingomonas sp. HMP9]|nr:hypothetical protein HMP09_0728 [Sphingomonas sp. HMP9]